jgi:hypothetical protein
MLCLRDPINGREINVAGDKDHDGVALVLFERRRDVQGVLQDRRRDLLRRAEVLNEVPIPVRALHRALHDLGAGADDGEQERRAEALPPMVIDAAGDARAAEIIG